MGDIEQLCQVIEEKEKFIQDKERTGFILLLYILKGNHTNEEICPELEAKFTSLWMKYENAKRDAWGSSVFLVLT